MTIMVMTRLPKVKLYGLLLCSSILGGIFVSSVMSSLNGSITIINSGSIAVPIASARAYESEIRAVFIHAQSMTYANWTAMANTLALYGINVVGIEWLGNNWAHYPSKFIPYLDCKMDQAVAAFHAKGMQVYCDMNVLYYSYIGDGVERRVMGLDYGTTGLANIKLLDYATCPTRQASRSLLKAEVEEIAQMFDIDGFMFDYIRYEHLEMCYCSECKAKFISDTNLTDVVWPDDIVESGKGGTGKYSAQFQEWRSTPINELVRDMRSWMLAIKPDLKFAAAAWDFANLPGVAPTYWRKWIGQDTTYWISQDWLDWVAPMNYSNGTAGFASTITGWEQYATGGAHGKVLLAPCITNQVNYVRTPADLARYVSTLRANGADGWMIWEYGGPGDTATSTPDITPYLAAIGLPNPATFTLSGISEQNVSSTSVQITWSTSLLATSNVEYSTSPLFTSSYLLWSSLNFHYWQVDHVSGTMTGNSANVTSHNITLANLTPAATYYFRVQSQDPSGIATSKVLTFTTGS